MTEAHVQRVHTEPVILEIGQELGALIIYAGTAFRGKEVEISPKGADAHRTHTDVAERRVNGRTVFVAVFPSLPAGDYTIWGLDLHHPTAVTIVGGAVAEVDWR